MSNINKSKKNSSKKGSGTIYDFETLNFSFLKFKLNIFFKNLNQLTCLTTLLSSNQKKGLSDV